MDCSLISPDVTVFSNNYGNVIRSSHDLYLPVVSYLVLLLSNIYAIRPLSQVDAAREHFEVAPILWRSALIGALTGLLPLTIILIIALVTPPSLAPGSSILLRIFVVLFIVLIGAPTPGAMMAVWLSKKMTFPVLLRSSAVAVILMFFGASPLVSLLGLLSSGSTLFYDRFSQPGLAFLIYLALLGVLV